MNKMVPVLVIIAVMASILPLSANPNTSPVSAQEDFIVNIGQDKVFTEFNYHDAWFEDDPNNPEPWPDQREAYAGDNIAYVSLSATPGHAGEAQALVGLDFDWDLGPYAWEEVEDLPVRVIVNFYYQIEAYWPSFGSANAGVNLQAFLDPWHDFMGYETGESGSRSNTVTETYQTTVGELEAAGRRIFFQVYCQAHAASNAIATHYSSARVIINSIAIEFDFKITHFMISLEYAVGPNGEEWYAQGVGASVYHRQGSEQIESFVAVDPSGEELPWISQESTSDSWIFGWFEPYLDFPTFGTYTITATDKDGHVTEVTSWPTDHVSDRTPIITDPVNYGYVTTGTPTFRWEPFSNETTGYLIEVIGPPEETLPDDDVVWRIALPAIRRGVEFNLDGTAAVPELTPCNTYHLLVFAYEDNCNGIQCYRDTSVRSIEFTVCISPLHCEAARLAKDVVGAPYLGDGQTWGGKGFDLNRSIFVSAGEIQNGYNFYNASSQDIEWGSGLDCSGLMFWAYNKASNAAGYRASENPVFGENAEQQSLHDFVIPIPSDKLCLGDVMFFNTRGEKINHVAMYVGPMGDGNDVVHAVLGSIKKIVRANKDDLTQSIPGFVGFRRLPEQDLPWMEIVVYSPVDLIVEDPDGFTITKDMREIPGVLYYSEWDIDGDGELDDMVVAPERKMGDYVIGMVPESTASPTDAYTLAVSAAGVTIVMAEDVQVSEIPSQGYIVRSAESEIIQIISTTIDFDPDTLNLISEGKFATVYIELPTGYDVEEIDINTLKLNDTVLAESKPTKVGDHDKDGVLDLMVKFDRAEVQGILDVGDEVEITVTGEVGGIAFEGSDIIRVIDK